MDYVPSTQKAYFEWQEALVASVTLNAAAWNIAATALAQLSANSATYTALYNIIKNKNTHTAQQSYAHKTYKKTYTKFLRGLVQKQLVNNDLITPDELVAMGLNPHLYIRTQRSKITDKPTIAPSNIGGGQVRFRCTTSGIDSKARHPQSDGIELFYTLEPLSQMVNPVDPKPGDPAPPAPAASEQQFVASIFSPKANFIYAFGINTVGKVLRVYGRWVNTSDAEKNSPTGIIASIVIS